MLVPISAKRPEGNAAASGVDRPVKRAKLSADFSEEDKTLTRSDVPGEYSEGDAGPSDLYLDTVGPTYQLRGSDVLTIVF
jgi:hypothetical protein